MGVSLERHGDRALAVVPIRLAPDASLDPATVRRRAIAWEREAERAWSGQVALQVSGMPPLTLDLDVRLDPPTGPATTVVVLPGAGPADLGGWRVDNPDGIAAHEIGHLLGAWDEYTHGAQDPTQPVIDRTHLMGRESPGAVPHPRSYEPLAAELAQRLGAPVAVVPLRPEAP
ncbi:MAG TPA: hypothetical protein PKA64_00030 [Myxococcota bacterium]|nr:hypothetical protein [Myxococcota bacterium]